MNHFMKMRHYFIMKINTMTISLVLFLNPNHCFQNILSQVIFIRSIVSHTRKNRPVNILIPKGCHKNMYILMMFLKIKRKKRIIFIYNNKSTNNSCMIILILNPIKNSQRANIMMTKLKTKWNNSTSTFPCQKK